MDAFSLAKPRLRLLLDHFAAVSDAREPWRVAYPLRGVLFLVVCATICNSDDDDDIVDWGGVHLDFLRRFSDFHHGIACLDWLRTLLNRVDPGLFSACSCSWVAQCWPQHADLVAIDGKTSRSRRSHDRKSDRPPLHLVSAFATNARLVLGQEAVDVKSNEITAIPALLERLDLKGKPGVDRRHGLQPDHRPGHRRGRGRLPPGGQEPAPAKAGDNQPTLHAEIESYFETAPANELASVETLDKGHGRLEIRNHTVSRAIDWVGSERVYPGAKRFNNLAVIAMVESRTEKSDKIAIERRSYIASRPLSAHDFANAVRSHWAIENSLHWVLDVAFKEDLSRLRTGHGARNMATVRHFALNLIRQAKDKRSIKRRRKIASWNPNYLLEILQPIHR